MADVQFFVSGGTLPLSAASYVERAADRLLFEALSAGRYAYVLNARQMGKSSLCVRTVARLAEAGIGTAFVDLTRVGGRNVTPDQWYVGLLGEIGRATGARAAMVGYWKENADLSPMQRFFGALLLAVGPGSSPLVVFVDEVDATRSLPFSADEFFGGVRECFNRRAYDPALERLTFCLLGAAIPSDLIRDMEASPFNVGERIAVKDFTKGEAMAFATGLGANGPALAERVFNWTNGHPFLTQSLCARLAEKGARTAADVDRLVEDDLFAPSARESNVNLADVGNRVLLSGDEGDPERHRAEILALYGSVRRGKRVEDDESSPRIAILKLAGLVVAENGTLKVRNRVYERVFGPGWIAEHMPDGEARRVRKAYRVGLLRAATAGAVLLSVVGALGASAVGNAKKAETNAHRAETALAQVKTERDRALGAQKLATAEKTRAERLAVERTKALSVAKADRDRATDSARLERLARQVAQSSTAKERAARQDALASAREAIAAGEVARAAAKEAKAAAKVAREKTLVALAATRRADKARDEAESLLYASNMQLVGVALKEGNGVNATSILEDSRAPGGKPIWVELHYRAMLDDGDTFGNHRGRIARVAFAPDGDLLSLDGATPEESVIGVVSSGKGTVRRWSARDGRLVGSFDLAKVPRGSAMDLAPDGKTLAVFKRDGSIEIRSTDGFGLEKGPTIAGGPIEIPNLLPYENRLLGSQDGHLRVWDTATGRIVEDLGALDRYPSYDPVSVFPDGDLLLFDTDGRMGVRRSGKSVDGTYVTKWSVPCGLTLQAKAISPDGRTVAIEDVSGQLAFLDAETGRFLFFTHTGARPGALAFSPDGQMLAIGSQEGTVRLVAARGGETRFTLLGRHPGLSALAFSPDGGTLAIGAADGTVVRRRLGDWTGASTQRNVLSSNASVSRDGRLLAFSDSIGEIALYDPRNGRRLRSLPYDGEAPCVAVSGDGSTVAAIDRYARRFRMWRAADGRLLGERNLEGSEKDAIDWSVVLSPDGRRALVHSARKNYGEYTNPHSSWLLQLAGSGKVEATPVRGKGLVAESAFSLDGRSYVVLWQNGLVQRLETATQRVLLSFRVGGNASGLACSPDGRLMAVGLDDGRIEVYDAVTGKRRRSWPAHPGDVLSVAFAGDGDTLLSSGSDDSLRTWDVRTWRSLGNEAVGRTSQIVVASDGGVYFSDGTYLQSRRAKVKP